MRVGLEQFGIKKTHEGLRADAVSYLRTHLNDAEVQKHIATSIAETKEDNTAGIKQQRASLDLVRNEPGAAEELRKIDDEETNLAAMDTSTYLDYIAQPNKFGGAAEIYALSQLHNIEMKIHRGDCNGPEAIEPGDEFTVPNPIGTIILAYENHHYNLRSVANNS